MSKGVYYHAGCPVCVEAERTILGVLDKELDVEVVHLGEDKAKINEAESAGVKSVPALVLDGKVMHINYGASLEDVKNG